MGAWLETGKSSSRTWSAALLSAPHLVLPASSVALPSVSCPMFPAQSAVLLSIPYPNSHCALCSLSSLPCVTHMGCLICLQHTCCGLATSAIVHSPKRKRSNVKQVPEPMHLKIFHMALQTIPKLYFYSSEKKPIVASSCISSVLGLLGLVSK